MAYLCSLPGYTVNMFIVVDNHDTFRTVSDIHCCSSLDNGLGIQPGEAMFNIRARTADNMTVTANSVLEAGFTVLTADTLENILFDCNAT